MRLSAGSTLVKPRGEPHALWNIGPAPARVLEILTPGGFEGYFMEIEPVLRGSGPDREPAFHALATRYGIEIMDDWVDDLERRFGVKL